MGRERYRSFVMDSARWDGFRFRGGDIVVSTPAKCGTTWMQMLCALLIFQDPALPRPLGELSPWLDVQTSKVDEVFALLEAQQHRRFIKSHTPLDGLPFDERVTYLCVGRDPRDVGLSWHNHLVNLNLEMAVEARSRAVGLDDLAELGEAPPSPGENPVDDFRQWVDDDKAPATVVSTLRSTLHHLETFWRVRQRPNVALFHFTDLQSDLAGQMRHLAQVLDIEVPPERWSRLVEAASFPAMKARADELAPEVAIRLWHDTTQFFNRGRDGQWRDLLGDDDLRRYDERVAELAPADLASWVHNGWAVGGS